MLFDEVPIDSIYSTQLFHQAQQHQQNTQIMPWISEFKQPRLLYSKKQSRVSSLRQKSRKKSVDERIQEVYKKYNKEDVHIKDPIFHNSRQKYRQKLNWLEKGQQFKQLGGDKIEFFWNQNPEEIETQRMKGPNIYCLGDNNNARSDQTSSKIQQSKCNHNFQRVLKIKQKLRKKHTLSNYKQKINNRQCNLTQYPQTNRQYSNDFNAKATLQKNKLKIKMRGLSRQKLSNPQQELSKIKVVGICSNAYEYTSQREGLIMNASSHGIHRQSHRPNIPGFMSLGQRQLSR